MPRPEKVAAVAEIKERIEGAKAVFLAEYAGLSVKDQQDLRRKLREQGAEFKVVKMTLARRAIAGLEIEGFEELLVGPTGIAFADTDAVSAAKALKDFASSHDVFSVKGGLLGADFLTAERIAALAEIAPRGELLAMLAGAMKAPLTTMAGLLAALPRQAATAMQQLLEKKESGEFAPAAAGETATAAPAEVDEADAEDEVEPPSAEVDVAADAEADAVAEDASSAEAAEDAGAEEQEAAPVEVAEEAVPADAPEDVDSTPEAADNAAPAEVEGDADGESEAPAEPAALSDEEADDTAADTDDDAGEVETSTAAADQDADEEPEDEEPAAAAEEEE